jgi:hypothetical protein
MMSSARRFAVSMLLSLLAACRVTQPDAGDHSPSATKVTTALTSAYGPFTLAMGQRLVSPEGLALSLLSNGDLSLAAPNGVVLWHAAALNACASPCTAQFQADGNLVLYAGATSYWATNTSGHTGQNSQLELSSAGPYIRITAGGATPWAGVGSFAPFTLSAGNSITLSDGLHLSFQTDGNLVLYTASNVALWSTSQMPQNNAAGFWGLTQGLSCASCFAAFQGDGNLVLYDPNSNYNPYHSYWASNTNGPAQLRISSSAPFVALTDGTDAQWTGGNAFDPFVLKAGHSIGLGNGLHLSMQTDGNLVLYDWAQNPLWATSLQSQNNAPGFTGLTQGLACSACFMSFQADGNLVLYDPSTNYNQYHAYWASNTVGSSGYTFQLLVTDQEPFISFGATPLPPPAPQPPPTTTGPVPQLVFDTSALFAPRAARPAPQHFWFDLIAKITQNPAIQYMSPAVIDALANRNLRGGYVLKDSPAEVCAATVPFIWFGSQTAQYAAACGPGVVHPAYLPFSYGGFAYVPAYRGYRQLDLGYVYVPDAALAYFQAIGLTRGDERFNSLVIYDANFGLMMVSSVADPIAQMAEGMLQAYQAQARGGGDGLFDFGVQLVEVTLVVIAPEFAPYIGAVGGALTAAENGGNVFQGAIKGAAAAWVSSVIPQFDLGNATISAAVNAGFKSAALQAVNNGKINLRQVGVAAIGGGVAVNVTSATQALAQQANLSPGVARLLNTEVAAASVAAVSGGNGTYVLQSMALAAADAAGGTPTAPSATGSTPYFMYGSGESVALSDQVNVVYTDAAGVLAVCGAGAGACTINNPGQSTIVMNAYASPANQLIDFVHEMTHASMNVTNDPLNIQFKSDSVIATVIGGDGQVTPAGAYARSFNLSELPAYLGSQLAFYNYLQATDPSSLSNLAVGALTHVDTYNGLYNSSYDILLNAKSALLEPVPQNLMGLMANPLGTVVTIRDSGGDFLFNAKVSYSSATGEVKLGFTSGGSAMPLANGVEMTIYAPSLGSNPTNSQVLSELSNRVSAALAWAKDRDPSGTYLQNLQRYNDALLRNATHP